MFKLMYNEHSHFKVTYPMNITPISTPKVERFTIQMHIYGAVMNVINALKP